VKTIDIRSSHQAQSLLIFMCITEGYIELLGKDLDIVIFSQRRLTASDWDQSYHPTAKEKTRRISISKVFSQHNCPLGKVETLCMIMWGHMIPIQWAQSAYDFSLFWIRPTKVNQSVQFMEVFCLLSLCVQECFNVLRTDRL